MSHSRRNPDSLLEILADYERVVEIGIGRRTDVAAGLAARGVTVTATDVHDRSVPDGVTFVRDDIVSPAHSCYLEADAIYGLNLPPELHRPALETAREAGADLLFTTLGGDQPTIPVERHTIESGTLYMARAPGSQPTEE